jgi:Fe-S oxidoreductase
MGGSSLSILMSEITEKCTECGACSENCGFLQKYGLPGEIAAACNPTEKKYQVLPFECSLCGLCAAVCPASLAPGDMFLEMRREAVSAGLDFPEHIILKDYERRGTSRRFSYYALPEGCDSVLFPGCTLSGTRPERVTDLFHHLTSFYPALGIIFDCCTKPSHDLGNSGYFNNMFGEMREFLVRHGVKTVLVACPNCYKVFRLHGESLKVKTVYEVLAEKGLPETSSVCGTVTIHDPCAVRFEGEIHSAVREIVSKKGLVVEEMEHAAEKTLCCGEGGAVGCLSPELSGRWTGLRKSEAGDKRILTYCAGCVNLLGKVSPTSHILDLIFDPAKTLPGKVKVSTAPFTYLNRLRLKRRMRKIVPVKISRERLFSDEATVKKDISLKPLIFIAIIAVAIATV